MIYSCISDVGLMRDKNQDSYLAVENQYGDFLALVADGIGGGKAGEVASGELVKYFNEVFKECGPFDSLDNAIDFMNYHLQKCNEYIFDMSMSNDDYAGMGTTVSGILITSKGCASINCGDSRTYGFIDNKIIKLTEDHTLVNQMLAKGQISYEESLNHPKRHYLTKAMGIFDSISADIHKVKDMDYYLCCSDGLHGYCDIEEIRDIIFADGKSLNDKCVDLKDLALMKGGFDNITAVLVKK